MTPGRSGITRFVLDNPVLLLAGTAAALVWANVDITSYDEVAPDLRGLGTISVVGRH